MPQIRRQHFKFLYKKNDSRQVLDIKRSKKRKGGYV